MYDGPGDDHRHAPDGALAGRGRRAERADRTSRHRRALVRNGGYAVYRASNVLADEEGGSRELGEAFRGRDSGSAPMSADVGTSMPAADHPQNEAQPQQNPGRRMLWIPAGIVG